MKLFNFSVLIHKYALISTIKDSKSQREKVEINKKLRKNQDIDRKI